MHNPAYIVYITSQGNHAKAGQEKKMASSPALKIYTAEGEYVGSAKDVIGAAVMVQVYGEGSTIRLGHSKKAIAWTQGTDGDATESYDGTGITMCQRFPQFEYLIRY